MLVFSHIEIVLQFEREKRNEETSTKYSDKALKITNQEERLFAENTIRKASFILVEL